MNLRRVMNRFALVPFAIFGMMSAAWAGGPGTLVYAPFAGAATTTSTPMLGTWMLLLLAALLAVVAYRVLRTRVSGRHLGLFALAGSLIAGGVASGNLIRLAHAQSTPPVYPMSTATGGTIYLSVGVQQITNTSGVPQQISSLTVTTNGYGFISPSPYIPQCLVNTVVAPNASCYLNLQPPV